MDFLAQLSGPMGGIFALGVSVGAAAGYSFALSRVAKAQMEAVVAPLKSELHHLALRLESLENALAKERAFTSALIEQLPDIPGHLKEWIKSNSV